MLPAIILGGCARTTGGRLRRPHVRRRTQNAHPKSRHRKIAEPRSSGAASSTQAQTSDYKKAYCGTTARYYIRRDHSELEPGSSAIGLPCRNSAKAAGRTSPRNRS